MNTSRGSRPKHLPNSPFAPAKEPVIEVFEVDDRVSHDVYGLGKIHKVENEAVVVDFGSQHVRVVRPYAKLHHL